MKKVVYSLLALAASTLVFSCIKNTVEEPVVNSQAEKFITVTCTINTPAPDSKVTLTKEDGKGKTKWVEGDEVFFHGKKVGEKDGKVYSAVAAAHDVSADGKTAQFTIPALDDKLESHDTYSSTMYAIYPASAVSDFSAGKSWYYVSGFKETNHFLLAACNDPDVNDGNTFAFYNLTGALSFKVSGDFDKYVFTGNNNETIGWDQYSVAFAVKKSDGKTEKRYRYKGSSGPAATTGSKTTIVVTPTDPSWANGTTVNTIYFPGTAEYDKDAVNFAQGFTIKFYKNDVEVKRVSTQSPKKIDVGDWLDLDDVTSHLYTYVAPATHNAENPPIAGATSLGEAANCYIVEGTSSNNDKVFKFKAFKGNSTVGVGKIEAVDILWETWNNGETVTENSVIAAVDYDKQEANDFYEICFKMPETVHAGNALIAAKDGLGNILWSWHIWVPATAITSNTHGIYSSALMDRNLGALVAATTTSVPVESFGLHYEWGRKDPFVGARGFTDSNFAKVYGSSISVGYEMTLSETIANPTQYAVYKSSDSWGNWLSPENDATLWEQDSKTINDPCPAGYRVPKYDSTQPMHSSDLSAVTGWSDNAASGENAAYFTLGDPVAVFPYCGLVCENGSYMDYPGARAFFWTTACNSDVNPRIIDVRLNTSTHKISSTVSSRGCSVRCVAIPAE